MRLNSTLLELKQSYWWLCIFIKCTESSRWPTQVVNQLQKPPVDRLRALVFDNCRIKISYTVRCKRLTSTFPGLFGRRVETVKIWNLLSGRSVGLRLETSGPFSEHVIHKVVPVPRSTRMPGLELAWKTNKWNQSTPDNRFTTVYLYMCRRRRPPRAASLWKGSAPCLVSVDLMAPTQLLHAYMDVVLWLDGCRQWWSLAWSREMVPSTPLFSVPSFVTQHTRKRFTA